MIAGNWSCSALQKYSRILEHSKPPSPTDREGGRKRKGGVGVHGCVAIWQASDKAEAEKTRPETQGSVTKAEANSTENATFVVITVAGEGSAWLKLRSFYRLSVPYHAVAAQEPLLNTTSMLPSRSSRPRLHGHILALYSTEEELGFSTSRQRYKDPLQ